MIHFEHTIITVEIKLFKIGRTPLIWATLNNHYNIVRLLLLANVDIEIKNTANQTALDIALENHYQEIISMLIERKDDKEQKTIVTFELRDNITITEKVPKI